ncbi:MAG TPA: penicillin-binding transpeptidase domain-containing protein [Candidatus Paceibacterota bacterium]|jgi:penicillin-binding protein 2|nr:penicillin-binding transpeptidase domain-containing protein [Candidatus Paceibacterota bacterium]
MLERFSSKVRKIFRRRSRYEGADIAPDEIFLDSSNLPDFDMSQFEGRFEKPIATRALRLLGFFFVLLALAYASRLWFLQIRSGDLYAKMSEENSDKSTVLFASRGIIYDRNGVELAWNDLNPDDVFPLRKYTTDPGFAHVLGYVTYPGKDKQGNFYEDTYQPVGGIEKSEDGTLRGTNGEQIVEEDALGEDQGGAKTDEPRDGGNVKLSIDSKVESEVYNAIAQTAHDYGFTGGAAIIMDVHTGEILAYTSFPEFDLNTMTNGTNEEKVAQIQAPETPFLDRVSSGLYTPGSIVKPYMSMAALTEHTIDPNKIIYTTGSLKIPNPYNPGQYSVFNDWKNLGPLDMRHAIAMSSDVYFYEVGGGFGDQKGLGIANIDKYMAMFGFGQKTGFQFSNEKEGVVPSIEWKKKTFGEDWLLGDTYHSSIGQYGWLVTPLQVVRAVASVANGGTLHTPTLLLNDPNEAANDKHLDLNPDYFEIVREGMRLGVQEGVATALNTPAVKIAAKTGTAELGITKDYVNSWVTGFFPYDNPHYAFAIVMEHGSRYNLIGASFVMRQIIDWMAANTPQYLQ